MACFYCLSSVQRAVFLLSVPLSHIHTSSVVDKLPYLSLFGETLANAASMQVESILLLSLTI